MKDQKTILASVLAELRYRKIVSNQTEMGEILDYGKAYFSQVMNGSLPLSEKVISKMETKFGINRNYLKTGTGEMIKGEQPTPPPAPTPAPENTLPFDQYLYQQLMTTKDQVINAERSASQTKDHVIKLQSDVAALRQEMNANFLTLISQVSQVSHSQVGYMNFLAEQFAAIRNKDPKAVKKELDKLIASGGGV